MSASRDKEPLDVRYGQQTYLIDLMLKMGYPVITKQDELGVCFGFANKALEAMLLREFDTFIARNKFIVNHPNLDKQLEAQRQERVNAIQKAKYKALRNVLGEKIKSETDANNAIKKLTAGQAETFNTLWQKAKIKIRKRLRKQEIERLEIPGYTDGILIYQDPSALPEWFKKIHHIKNGQNTLTAQRRGASKRIRKKGGLAEAKQSINSAYASDPQQHIRGMYDKSEIATLFTALRETMIDTKSDEVIPMLISDKSHTITVGFDAKLKCWYFADANYPPGEIIPDNDNQPKETIEEITKRIMHAFRSSGPANQNDKICAEINVFHINHPSSKATALVNLWASKPEIKAIHTVTPEKAAWRDNHGDTWLTFASGTEDWKTAEQLVQVGAKVNDTESITRASPLHFAVMGRNLEMVDLLLINKADPNAVNIFKNTPLCYAVVNNDLSTATSLLHAGANPNVHSELGMTLLYAAISTGTLSMVNLLLKHGADVNMRSSHVDKTQKGPTPLKLAAVSDMIATVKTLIANGAYIEWGDFSTQEVSECSQEMRDLLEPLMAHAKLRFELYTTLWENKRDSQNMSLNVLQRVGYKLDYHQLEQSFNAYKFISGLANDLDKIYKNHPPADINEIIDAAFEHQANDRTDKMFACIDKLHAFIKAAQPKLSKHGLHAKGDTSRAPDIAKTSSHKPKSK